MHMVEAADRSPQLACYHNCTNTTVCIGDILFDNQDDATDPS